jgi:hypothetical protein
MNGNERPKPRTASRVAELRPSNASTVGAPAMPNPARTRARQMVIEHARLMPTQRFRAKKWPSQEESARAGGVRGPWRRAPVETPAVGRCRQRVLQVAAVGKLFGCHIPGDTPCSQNCMLHSRCCMLQVAIVDRRFPGVTCMPQWRHVCPRRKCCEGTRCEPTAALAQYTLVCLWLTDELTAARVLSANVRCKPHYSVRNRI